MADTTPTPIPTSDGQAIIPARLSKPVDGTLYESVARLSMLNALSGMAFTSVAPSSFTLTIDAGPEGGGEHLGHEPLELLLLSLGSCTGMDVISILRKKRQQVTGYRVNVFANQAKEYPQIYTEILVEHIVEGPSVDPTAVARSLQLSITKYCPVHALLSKATKVEHVYRVLDSTLG